ncbi:MAG: nuclear transport factor 2 family protein [Xanthomonadales bacterium]|jgi:hypothetical protein|nr:nuclear transport factor 2 family protein [Xanthomonadales bacterium]
MPHARRPATVGSATRRGGFGRRAFFVLLLGASVQACRRTPDEAALRATLDALQAAAERRDTSEVLAQVDPDFAGIREAGDREALRRYLMGFFLAHPQITITRPLTEVQLKGEYAEVRVRFLVTGSGRWLAQGRWVEAQSVWRFRDGRWLLLNARWSA